jgi:hypothetical protein
MSALEIGAGRARRATGRGAATSIGSSIAFALAPKCPLCVAAWLSALGLGATGAGVVAPLLRPIALCLAIGAALVVAFTEIRAFRDRRRAKQLAASGSSGCCCAGSPTP